MSVHPLTAPPDGHERRGVRLERLIRPLLQQMMTRADRFRDTPLQFEIDSAGITLAAWNSYVADVSTDDLPLLLDGERLCAALDHLIEQAFDDGELRAAMARGEEAANRSGPCEDAPPVELAGPSMPGRRLQLLAEWLDRLCSSLRAVHARAIEVVGLRIEDYTARDIAQRQGTGLRLVRRLLTDARAQHERSVRSR